MRVNFIILCIALVFLVMDKTILVTTNIHLARILFDLFELNIISYKYGYNITILIFYLTLLIFIVNTYKQLTKNLLHGSVINKPETHSSISQKLIAGIAASSLLSCLFVVAMAAQRESLGASALIYILYVTVCGVVIIAPVTTPIKNIVLYSLWPSATFLIFSSILLLIASALGDLFSISSRQGIKVNDLLIMYVILSFCAIPLITAASIGRNMLIDFVIQLANIPNDSVEKLSTNIKNILAILAIISGAILGVAIFS